jgi:hypothetical protein
MEDHSVVALLRRLEIQRDARRDYLADAERLDALAREHYRAEEIAAGDRAHYWALWLTAAAEAEIVDPEPR